ncbi:MAG: DUF1080 domain-containing protein [Planctomycetales bacterium]|nr:DUF1080 domain-containing protein [Planctomycetales bacterium]
MLRARVVMSKPLFPMLCALLAMLVSVAIAESPSNADADGFVDLFANGDFSLWKVDGTNDTDRARQTELWSIDDGVISASGKKYGFIRYDRELRDFELRLEYQLDKGGNSGIGLRGAIYKGGGSRPSAAGYELQLLADAGRTPNKHSSMSLYRYVAPSENAVRPPGEWNEVEVICRGPHIRVTVNGKTVQDLDQTTIDAIKNKPLHGYLLLQNHGSPVKFRHVRLKELDDAS